MEPRSSHSGRTAGATEVLSDAWAAVRRVPWAPMGLLVALAAALRIAVLDMPMRLDEATTFYQFLVEPWRVMVGKYVWTNNHPLHSILARIGVDLLGPEPWVIRLPAAIFGVVLVPVTFLATSRMLSPAAGWYAAAGVAVLPAMVLFSANARGYTMVAVFALLQWLALRDGLRTGRVTSWAMVALLGALGVYTHLTMAFAYAGSVAWALVWLWHHRPDARARLGALVWSGCASVAVAALLYAPMVLRSGPAALMANRSVSARSPEEFGVEAAALVRRLAESWLAGLPGWMGVGLGLLATLGLLVGVRRRVEGWAPLLMVATYTGLVLVSLRVPPPRSALFLLPVVLAAVGEVVARLASGRSHLTATLLWGVAAAPLALVGARHAIDAPVRRMTETGWVPEGPAVHDRLRALMEPGDAVATLWLTRDPIRYEFIRHGTRVPPVAPEYCPVPGSVLYVLARDAADVPRVLRDSQLPPDLAAAAEFVETVGRLQLLRIPVEAPLACGPAAVALPEG